MKQKLQSILFALIAIMMPIGAWAEGGGVVVQIGTFGVSTFYYSSSAYVIPENVTASIITGIEMNNDGTVRVVEKELEDGVIPAGCAVILRGGDEDVYVYEFPIYKGDDVQEVENLLQGTDDETTITEEGYLYFCLSSNDKGDVDWKYKGVSITNQAHKAYLALPVAEYPGLVETLNNTFETLETHHLQHTHGGCEICGQVTTIEAKWGASADAESFTYGTLAQAFAAACTYDDETAEYIHTDVGYIQLQSDVNPESSYVIYGGEFTIDLNGCTLENYLEFTNGEITITDESDSKAGKMITSQKDMPLLSIAGATLKINGGTYITEDGGNHVVSINGNGKLTINDGSFSAAPERYVVSNWGDGGKH